MGMLYNPLLLGDFIGEWMRRSMNILFPKKTRLKDVVMVNPPPPPLKKGYRPINSKLDLNDPPKGGSGVK